MSDTVFYHSGPTLTGRVVRLMPGYAREMKVGQPALVVVLTAATVGRLIGRAILSALQAGTRGASPRRWKELRKAPEFLVTPLRLRDGSGRLCEVEIHGHLPQSALEPSDHIQVTVAPQKDRTMPPKAERIVNITTGQLLRPRVPTLWSHIGPALILQAFLGLTLVGIVAAGYTAAQ
ncbi:hypothetical protein Ais01nite_55700 [Asanoa ishikariensis]|uniref:Uncharacterized protein n=1 Tax=Asanoa ishikariensis TaxID=137265 RepID=A0A1H3TV63_9ACTN|nr:hypothetical protein [Asanoa ishikariensis]GIF67535.1 hypothetical protein Ais01nite_55700 [Asanoa ishikariensis]SDZ53967.1 hypothetical protein SAMN05421684_6429 [Asanoa ishikariensis]